MLIDQIEPSRGAVSTSQCSLARRRTIAEPTIPRCPATKTRFPFSENRQQLRSCALRIGAPASTTRSASTISGTSSRIISGSQPSFSLPWMHRRSADRLRSGGNIAHRPHQQWRLSAITVLARFVAFPAQYVSTTAKAHSTKSRTGGFAGAEDDSRRVHPAARSATCLDIVARVTPIALGRDGAEIEPVLPLQLDRSDRAGYLRVTKVRLERAFMVKKDAVAGEHPVGFAIVTVIQ